MQPTRLAAAERAARAFVGGCREARVGVVAFSSAPDAACRHRPPTALRCYASSMARSAVGPTATGNALALALALLETPRHYGGSSAGGGGSGNAQIRRAQAPTDPVPRAGWARLRSLSDGAANSGRAPVEVATEAGVRKIPIYTVALGNADADHPKPERLRPTDRGRPDPGPA